MCEGDEIGVIEGPGTPARSQPVRWHAHGHACAPGRTPASGPAGRVAARGVTGLPVSIVGWGGAVPDGASRTPISKRASTPTTRGSSSAPASANVASPAPTRRPRRSAPPRPRHAIKRAGLTPDRHRPPRRGDGLARPADAPHRRVRRRRARAAVRLVRPERPRAPGFVYELVVGASMLHVGYEHVLIVGTETLSRITDPDDRGDRDPLRRRRRRGRARGARRRRAGAARAGTSVATAPRRGLIEIPAGGSRRPTRAETVAARGHYMKMQGQEVFRRAVRAIADSARPRSNAPAWILATSTGSSRTRPTSASSKPPRSGSASRPERTIVNIERYGNTSSASIPLALFEAVEDGRVATATCAVLGRRRGPDVGERAHPLGRADDARRTSRVRHRRVARHRSRDSRRTRRAPVIPSASATARRGRRRARRAAVEAEGRQGPRRAGRRHRPRRRRRRVLARSRARSGASRSS